MGYHYFKEERFDDVRIKELDIDSNVKARATRISNG